MAALNAVSRNDLLEVIEAAAGRDLP